MQDSLNFIVEIFEKYGSHPYGGVGPITELEHGLGCAELAEHDGAPDPLIAAALLHDFGHLISEQKNVTHEMNNFHEKVGYEWLSKFFIAAVSEPIKYHVEAKRWLCYSEPGYIDRIYGPCQAALEIQGGVMNKAEAKAFLSNPFSAEAILLRRWDDRSSVKMNLTKTVKDYIPMLEKLLR